MSDKTKDDAMKIARGTQKPGQTKEQTKLISRGIQKGIEQYKKQQSVKDRERDKRLKKAAVGKASREPLTDNAIEHTSVRSNVLPWLLLILSWLGFAAYIAAYLTA